jgi:hypothetical protein
MRHNANGFPQRQVRRHSANAAPQTALAFGAADTLVQGDKCPAGLAQHGAFSGFIVRVSGFTAIQFSGNTFAGNRQQIPPFIGANGKIHTNIIPEKPFVYNEQNYKSKIKRIYMNFFQLTKSKE